MTDTTDDDGKKKLPQRNIEPYLPNLNPNIGGEELARRLSELLARFDQNKSQGQQGYMQTPIVYEHDDRDTIMALANKLANLEAKSSKYLEAYEIERIAKAETFKVLQDIGIPMDSIGETAAQFQFLMSLRKGARTFILTVLGSIGTIIVGILTTYFTTKK